jgi:hypothetical protein
MYVLGFLTAALAVKLSYREFPPAAKSEVLFLAEIGL